MALAKSLPWTKTPLIINAPMGGHAGADLAIAVTKAGGLGHIGAGLDLEALTAQLEKAEQTLPRHDRLLPLGLGLLQFVSKVDDVLPILQRFRPAVVWLFAAVEAEHYGEWAQHIRAATPQSQIWIQVGSVQAAVQVAREAKPDVICVQGIDAGGHGFEKGAGIISLLPEVTDALKEAGHGHIHLVAAGGIADGRGAAAAFALGAEGVVLGTRFLASPEIIAHPGYKRAVLHAHDGGQVTGRDKLYDNLGGPNIWPEPYDGRSLVNESFAEYANGVGIDKIRRRHSEAVKESAAGFGVDGKGRAAMWAGTGVGLVRKEQPAGEIVQEIREQALDVLANLRSRL